MIKLTIKHEGKEYSGELPSSWNEIKVRHFIAMNEERSETSLLSFLAGIDLDIIENARNDISQIVEKMNILFNEPPPDLEKLKRRELFIDGKKIKFPKDLNFTRYGQKSLVRNLLASDVPIETIVPDVFAIYAQPIIDGKFDSTRIEAIKSQVLNLPIVEVYPHVLFFFKRLRESRLNSRAKLAQYLKPPDN